MHFIGLLSVNWPCDHDDGNATLPISNNERTSKTATKHSRVNILHLFVDYSVSDDLFMLNVAPANVYFTP